ncbi:glutamine-hydrolyzing carbamoyl-phosphate synthase small subunit [Helicobacter saguini]|uniref:Carbamoyl phosphate synthase small chain n=1 Tax=Helicobacter saguini TaxID=1548018 RepID=A0A347VPG1_9HELI|nr:glutamine-hydrolyzing carbamoyl-phosphate synthase small subunit [Helicobacter saguini]MWV61377.1 glutamine-hydrolyzing carbamoyl-phosphate synthase small subunit [Helicobacter saguini]MWV67954.1 glutamine-hydrolyzing carbamoyl-phosphate synthase small subunit [Helicobacter saguini]MWV70579.1 glutamine-hydrolyzing carbamoyl-phosphate synthase small subunit [Helicobacter saguini]MWV72482.1 glutamine-hydrolyzing carbamoyl-phosphate synthase small subunit [Helicobacter saguini]TLD94768.1 carba
MELFDVSVYFENGLFLRAKGFGVRATSVGEVVFNTSLTGYQEIISDSSYAGQFVVFCMPEIGIVGCNPQDMESKKCAAKGIFVRHIDDFKSNFRATQTLDSFLKEQNVIGICNIDTRSIVKMLRNNGALHAIVSSEIHDIETLKTHLKNAKKIHEIDYIKQVSTSESYIHKQGIFDFGKFDYADIDTKKKKKKVVTIDFGVKRNILNELSNAGLIVEVVPQDFDAQQLVERYKKGEIDGVFLSNGPGDPAFLSEIIEKIKVLIESKMPIFAICLGHQLLSNAFGHPTYKLKFGQHGGNHPVKNLQTNTLEITSQNHNYNVPESIAEVAIITHRNLFDNTIEGVKYKDYPIFSLQHHPEASPGPKEASAIFREFVESL